MPMGFSIILAIPCIVIAVVMLTTVSSAKKGKIVAINTITGISIAGIIISALMLVLAFAFSLILLLSAGFLLTGSILYKMSLKNIKLANIGAILAMCSTVIMLVTPFLSSVSHSL